MIAMNVTKGYHQTKGWYYRFIKRQDNLTLRKDNPIANGLLDRGDNDDLS